MISREVRGLERAMDALAARFVAQASNVANVNTPHYQRQSVAFEDALRGALDSEASDPTGQNGGDPLSRFVGQPDSDDMLELFKPTTTVGPARPQRVDGNGTSLEAEMSAMVKTVERYNTAASQIATQYRTFKYITDQK